MAGPSPAVISLTTNWSGGVAAVSMLMVGSGTGFSAHRHTIGADPVAGGSGRGRLEAVSEAESDPHPERASAGIKSRAASRERRMQITQ